MIHKCTLPITSNFMFLDNTLSDTFNSSIFKLIIFFVFGISTSSKKKLILSSTSGTSVNSVSSNFFSCDFKECIFFFKTLAPCGSALEIVFC